MLLYCRAGRSELRQQPGDPLDGRPGRPLKGLDAAAEKPRSCFAGGFLQGQKVKILRLQITVAPSQPRVI